MKTSINGLNLIAKFEGFSAKPYVDPGTGGEPITIGFGSTFYPNGTKVTMKDKNITKEEALEYLKSNLSIYEKGVNDLVKAPITQNMFDSLVSFAYNVGANALKSSTLLKKLNINPKDASITEEFKKWSKSGGKVMKGLLNRRIEEAMLYWK